MTSEHEPDLELKAELDRLLVTPAMPKTWDDVKERARRKGWTPKRQKHLAPQIDSEAPDQRPPDTARARAHRRSRGTRFTAYAFLVAVLVAAVALGSLEAVQYLSNASPVIVIGDDPVGLSPTSSGGQASQPVATSAPGATPVSLAEPPRRLLIVGNLSLAPSGGLETDLAALAESLDPARTIDVDFVWGWMSSSAVFGEDTVRTAIRDGDYDVVMLQLQEDLVEDWGESTGSLFENARLFDQEIKDAGARTVLFMSWPWKDDAFPTAAWATLQVIAQAHRDLGSALEAPVTPIALAFAQALEEQPGLAMVGNDWMPTEAASYLAACVVYATLFGESPAGATYAAEGVSTDGAAFLQRVAWDTVTVWYGK
jgi:hypothetical protein